MILGLDHISIATTDLEEAIQLWESRTGATVIHREFVADQKVDVAMLMVGTLKIEIVAPRGADSPIAKFLATRGPGIHHLALNVNDTQSELNRMKTAGMPLIDQVARIGAHDTKVGFVHPKTLGGVLLELVEHTDDRS